jgi:GNAT superfamily N-acetyltransferase
MSIAHPDFRGELLAAAKQRHFVPVGQLPWPEGGKPYPLELESSAAFNGVDIRFRPIKPSDERLLREFFYSHSADTVYQRYHAPLKSLSPQQIQRLCTLDYDREMALIGIVPEGEADKIVAVGRYIVDPSTNLAEVAFTIHDQLQSRGIGTWLLKRLIEIARNRGVLGFVGFVLPGNVRMLNLFHRSGFPVVSKLEQGEYTVTIRFPEGGRESSKRA